MKRAGVWAAVGLLCGAVLLGGLYVAWWMFVPSLVIRALSAQGFEHALVEVAWPTRTHLDVPLLTFQRTIGTDRATVTIEQARVEYTLASLWDGRVERLVISQASVHLAPAVSAEPVASAAPAASFTEWLHPIPQLPIHEVLLGWLAVRREGHDGAIHEGTAAGTLRVDGGRASVAATVQPKGGPAYVVTLDGTSLGEMALQITTSAVPPTRVFALASKIVPSDEQVSLSGTVQVDVHDVAPLVALVLPLDGAIQDATGNIHVAWTGSASARVSPADVLIQPDTAITGTYRISGTIPAWAETARNVTGATEGTWAWAQRQLTWTFAQGAHWEAQIAEAALTLPAGLLPQRGVPIPARVTTQGLVEGLWDGAADRAADRTEESPAMRLRGPLSVQIGSRATGLLLEATSSSIAWQGGTQWRGEGMLRIQGAGGPTIRSWCGAQHVTADLAAAVAVTAQQIELRMQPGAKLQLAGIVLGEHAAAHASLAVQQPLQWRMVRDPAAVPAQAITSGEIELRADGVTVAGQAMAFERATVAVTQLAAASRAWSGWTGEGRVRVIGMRPTVKAMTVATGDWSLDGRLDAVGVTAQVAALLSNGWVSLSGTGAHHADTGRGEARITLAPVRMEPARALSTLVTPWSAPFDATGGTLEGSGTVAWERTSDGAFAPRQGTVHVQMKDVAGRMQQVTFAGLTTDAQVQLRDGIVQMPEPAPVALASVRAGLDVTGLAAQVQAGWDGPSGGRLDHAEFSWTPAWIDLKKFRSELFGGVISSDGLRYRPGQTPHALTLSLQGIQLQAVLNLEQQKGLDGTGVLDGTIPMTLGAGGLSVEQGTVAARPPGGVIRYRPAADSAAAQAASHETLGMVLQPLADFHYNVLTATARLVENGTLTLATRLEGRNPGWQAGRPVHFNLTVEENIPALLKTLGLVNELQESIGKRFEPQAGGAPR